jgi:hypothetical protein
MRFARADGLRSDRIWWLAIVLVISATFVALVCAPGRIQTQLHNSPREGAPLRKPTLVAENSALISADARLTPNPDDLAALRAAEAKLAVETDKLSMISENVLRAMKELKVTLPLMRLEPEEALARGDLEHMRVFFVEKMKQSEQGELHDEAALRVKAARIACFSDPEKPHYEARVTFELKVTGPELEQAEQALRKYVAPDDVSVAVTRLANTPLWTVSVLSLNARNAAQRADGIVEALVWILREGEASPVVIWEKAEIAAEPLHLANIEESE